MAALVVVIGHPGGAADQNLLDERHGGLGFFSQHMVVDGNLAPSEHEEFTFFQNLFGDRAGAGGLVFVVRGQEHDAHSEVAGIVEGVAKLLHFGSEDFVGNLCGDARAITGFRIRIQRTTVHEAADG